MKTKITLKTLSCWGVLLILALIHVCHAVIQGPIITSATFTSDGRKVIGIFNMETDRAGYPVFHQFACDNLIEPWTTMKFGQGNYCVWTSNRILQIVLGFDNSLEINWSIGILPYKVAPLNGGPLQDSQAFLDPPVGGFDQPTIAIVGPIVLGGCEEYVQYWVDNKGGLAASIEPYVWEIQPTGETSANNTELIASYFRTTNNFVSLDSSQVPVGTYVISVTVTNRFGGTGQAILNVERRDDSINTPLTHIDGATSITITPSQPLTLKGAVTQTCASTNLKLSWSQTGGQPLPNNVVFLPSLHLFVPSKALTFGNYTFKFMTTVGDSAEATSASYVEVLVVPDAPIINISPANLIIATSASFILDASDSRVAPNSVFTWRCYNTQNPTVSCMEPYFSNQVFSQSEPYINVPSHSLRSNGSFIFEVAVTDPYGVVTKASTVVNMVSNVPAVQIETIATGLEESGLVDPQQGLTLIAHASSPDIFDNTTFTYTWSCPLLSLPKTASRNPALYLAPSQLSPGQTYTFTVSVYGSFGAGAAAVTLTMNIPASGGGCTATPLIHTDDGNPFWLECFSFSDDNYPDNSIQSIRYHFHYVLPGGFEVPLTTIPQSSTGLLASLPIGSSKVVAHVIDASGSYTTLEMPVVVNAPNSTLDYLDQALLLSGDLLTQAINLQDMDSAVQLILRSSVLLNKITESKYQTNITLALRSQLLSLLQSDINFFSTELGSQSVIQKAYLVLNLVPPVYGELTTDLITQAIAANNYLMDDVLVDDFASREEFIEISLALASRILGSSFPPTNLTVGISPNNYNYTLNVNNDDDFDGVSNPSLKPVVIGNQQTSDALVDLVNRVCTLAIANQSPGSTVTTALQTPYIYVGIRKDYPAQIPWYYQYTPTFFVQLPYDITTYMKEMMGDTAVGTALIVYHLNPYQYTQTETTSPIIGLHFYSAENFTEIPYPQMKGTDVEISIPFHSSLNHSTCQTWNPAAHKWGSSGCKTVLPSSTETYPYPINYTPVLTCVCSDLQITSVAGPAMVPDAIVYDVPPAKSHKKDWAIWVLVIIPIAIIAYFLIRRRNQKKQNNNSQPASEFSNIAPALSVATGAPRRRQIEDDSDSDSEEELQRKNQNKSRDNNRRKGHRSDSSRDSRHNRRPVHSDSDSDSDTYTVSSSSRGGKPPRRSGANLGKGKNRGSSSDLSISGSDSSRDNRRNAASTGVGSKRVESGSEEKELRKTSKKKAYTESSESEVEELSRSSKASKNSVSTTSTSSEDLSKKR
eukprot:TRINITY_DN5707_c0_g3_i1.p1 TRINITY_DN5707_c0_g3~~TRINITY_DN5707_c0_g3_i1.p1  ORF type:complete len:1334 (-),score=322.26 TRINITY_DN5707_c0_g3_i1:41-3838(-)